MALIGGVDPAPGDAHGRLVERCWVHVQTGEATLVVDVEHTVRADESRIRQCLENLSRNAVDYDWDVRVTEGSAGVARFEFTGVSSASQ